MPMFRRVCLLACLSAPVPALAHEVEFAPHKVIALRDAVTHVRALVRAGALTPERAWDVALDVFTSEELAHLCQAPVEGVPEELHPAFVRVVRVASLRRGAVGRLSQARTIAFHLAGDRETDWMRAFRELRREPFSKEADAATVALGRDPRPAVRYLAARHASLLMFCGRKARGLRATVMAALTDDDPNVAASVTFCVPDTGDLDVMDGLVSGLSDERRLRQVEPGSMLEMAGHETVRDAGCAAMLAVVWFERSSRGPLVREAIPALAKDRGLGRPVQLTPDEYRTWWKENRADFGFGAPPAEWDCVFAEVVVLDVGKATEVVTKTGKKLTAILKAYREGWVDGVPVVTHHLEIFEGEGEWTWNWVDSEAEDFEDHGDIERGGAWGTRVMKSLVYLPTPKEGRVRIMLKLHVAADR